jgi:ribosome-interacting GTPase 1
MPINAHPDFLAAEKVYITAETKEQKIAALKKMISHAPGHKGAENLRAQLKRRLARLKYANEKEIKQKKGGKQGIRKEDMQGVIVGKTGVGKSWLLKNLTNATPKIASSILNQFTTKIPVVGMMPFQGTNIQLIEIPAIESKYYDKGLVHTADVILILITNLQQLSEIEKNIENFLGKKIIVFNNINKENSRKISSTLSSKKYNFILINSPEDLEKLKEKIFQSIDKIRIYTKEPGKDPDKNRPLILDPKRTIKDAAKKIIRNLENIKEIRIWGPSSKFSGQIVGFNHELKDLDIVEFKTK